MLFQKMVISWHLLGKDNKYSIDNKLDQLAHKIFATIFVTSGNTI